MTLDSSSSIERSNLVMMSATKHLGPANEILRCAQDDNLLPILLVKLHYRPHRHSVNVLLEEERPSQGRPQGSHPLILTTPAHTKTRIGHCPLRSLCKGGGRVVRSGDPCGRPGVGLWPVN